MNQREAEIAISKALDAIKKAKEDERKAFDDLWEAEKEWKKAIKKKAINK